MAIALLFKYRSEYGYMIVLVVRKCDFKDLMEYSRITGLEFSHRAPAKHLALKVDGIIRNPRYDSAEKSVETTLGSPVTKRRTGNI